MLKSRRAMVIAALACVLVVPAHAQNASRQRATALLPPPPPVQQEAPKKTGLVSSVTLGDIGFTEGLRFSNLGGRREIFVPMPPGGDLSVSELTLAIDDVSAHEARRSLEILVNDRSAAAIALDGKSMGRLVRVSIPRARGRDGFIKLGFSYSGAATQDRCIDVRYIGDSLTVRPETAIEIEIGAASLDVATTAAVMPREVAVIVSGQRLAGADIAAALTVGRTLKASGRRVSFHHGFDQVQALARRDDPRRWTRGIVLIGAAEEIATYVDPPAVRVAGPTPALGALAAVRAGGAPALLVSDAGPVRAARLFASPHLPAARGVALASVGDSSEERPKTRRISFDRLGLAPAIAEVFGRAEISFVIPTKTLPAGLRPSRLALDLMVAPDGAGEKAVISVFVNTRLLGSAVAAVGEASRLDLDLPEGLVGADMNVRVVIQRRSAQGDCRFEPQGYPAQVLGSSAVVLVDAGPKPHDFAELAAWWADGIEVWVPSPASERPAPLLGLIADALTSLSPEIAPVTVKFTAGSEPPAPLAPFVAVSNRPPAGATPRVRFDRGRVLVSDRTDKTLLDVGGFTTGAVAQIVSAGSHPGIWIKPLAADGALPAPPELRLDRGDVAFVDHSGIALAMSTERDTLIRVSYPDQVSWFSIAERFHAWIVGAFWLLVTVAFLFALQRILRRRAVAND